MKLRIVRVIVGFNGRLSLERGHLIHDPENRQVHQPVRATTTIEREVNGFDPDDQQYWLYRNRLVLVEDASEVYLSEIEVAVKHEVLCLERKFAEMKRDVELFEKGESLTVSAREPIPRETRVLVWRRDQARCVVCGGVEKLEFDHIIPLAKGGGNSERNIQLLCEGCNRSKATSI